MNDITPDIVKKAKTDVKVRNEIIVQLIPYVKSLANNFEKRLRDDLEIEGVFGIINAIEQFDPSKKDVKFTTYAYYKIRDLMSRFLYKENRSFTLDTQEEFQTDSLYNNDSDEFEVIENNIDISNALKGLSEQEKKVFQQYHLEDVSLNDIKNDLPGNKSLESIRKYNLNIMQKIRNNIMNENQNVTIKYTPIQCKIIGKLSTDVIDTLWNTLSFYPQNFEYSEKFQLGHWDGVKRLFSKQTYKFRSGLLLRVTEIFKMYGVTYFIDDQSFEIPFVTRKINNIPALPFVESRDYQKEAIEVALTVKRGGISLPPRTGKTIIAAGILNALKNKKALFLCFTIEIAIQTKTKFEKLLNQPIGFICDGKADVQNINVASVQSILSAYDLKWDFTFTKEEEKPAHAKQQIKDLLEETEVIICDEYHHYTCKSAEFIFNKAKNVNYLLGLSATPWRIYEPESILLENNIGPVIYHKSYDEMIEKGFLLPAHIYIYKMPKSKDNNKIKSYQTLYKEFITDNELRNSFIARIANKLVSENRSCVIIVSKKLHATTLQRLIYGSVILWGDHDSQYRQDVLVKLENKEVLVVISTLLDEGVDLQSLNAVIVAAGGKSSIDVFQRMRCLTPHPSKQVGLVFDFWDTVKYLKKHSLERFSWYEQINKFEKFYRTLNEDGTIRR